METEAKLDGSSPSKTCENYEIQSNGYKSWSQIGHGEASPRKQSKAETPSARARTLFVN